MERGIQISLAGMAPALAAARLGQSESAITGASVKLTDRDTGAKFETHANQAGMYRMAAPLPGNSTRCWPKRPDSTAWSAATDYTRC